MHAVALLRLLRSWAFARILRETEKAKGDRPELLMAIMDARAFPAHHVPCARSEGIFWIARERWQRGHGGSASRTVPPSPRFRHGSHGALTGALHQNPGRLSC